MLWNILLCLLFLSHCIYVYCNSAKNYSEPLEQCFNSECLGNKTKFYTSSSLGGDCYCDEACYKMFYDCCPDYEEQCGRQDLEDKTSPWECVKFNFENWDCDTGAVGIWMISKCPPSWPADMLRKKCENVPSQFFYPVEDFLPVVGETGETYRNKHCALCNGMENYNASDFEVSAYVTPPDELDLNSKLKFIMDNGGSIKHVRRGTEQRWRSCMGEKLITYCPSPSSSSYKACIEGPVELVGNGTYYKNQACAKCNGHPKIDSYKVEETCESTGLVEAFSVVFDLRKPSEIVTVTPHCPRGTVYDTSLKFCREGYFISATGKLNDEFIIVLWSKLSRELLALNYGLDKNLISALISRFSLQDNQISQLTFYRQNRAFFVATFLLTLTPFQSLLMINQHKPILNVTNQNNTAFLTLLNFTGNFTISSKESTFIVVKMISKQLSCYEKKELQSHEYKIDNDNQSLVVNKTGKIFLLEDYTLIKEEDGNITLCRKLLLSDCNEGAYVPLSSDEYVVFPNLTVYHNATERVFHFGDYLISENKDIDNTSNATFNSLSTSNSTISVCLSFKDTFTKIEMKYSETTTSYALRILTLIFFSVSIICLLLLLIVYGLFQELRTVPGMNLMNLSLSMLLSHLIWLVGTSYFSGTKTCKVLAMLEHYTFQVSFVAMSVISYHSCYVFAQPFAGRVVNKSGRRFIAYSLFVWLAPAIFVAVCVTLDKTETFLVDYRTNCWLGTVNAKLYLFLLPLAILLLFNIVLFIRTAISLYRHEKGRHQILQRKKEKQNLLICTKLATLVGFPWLFAFIGVLFPNVEAFDYLFVVFVCLQGLYIGMAFMFNKKTLKLFKDRWNIGSRGNAPSISAQAFEMT